MKSGTIRRETPALPERLDPSVRPEALAELFDHVPEVVFFVKDSSGRYVAANQTLAERCGLRDRAALIGRHVRDLFPSTLAARYAAQDDSVLKTGRPLLDRLELHWYSRGREGWCLSTKLPLRNVAGEITGLIGISRDLRTPGERDSIPATLVGALEFLEAHYAEPMTPVTLAQRASLPPSRFARLIKRIFRITPSQLITQARLSVASRLLRETDKPVAEVALASGFYDHSAFTRAFRSATGLTPSEFRSHRVTKTPKP